MSMFQVREAKYEDLEEIAQLQRLSREAAMPDLVSKHTPEEDVAFFSSIVFRECNMWVVESAYLYGFCASKPGWLDHLYVHPDKQGKGVGSDLLEQAMKKQNSLRTWVFHGNDRAKKFFEKHGFKMVQETDNGANEDHLPKALYQWRR